MANDPTPHATPMAPSSVGAGATTAPVSGTSPISNQGTRTFIRPQDEQRILITQAKPGMVLSRTVELPNRVRLCPSGTELTEGLIARLFERGIRRIHVFGHPIPSPTSEEWNQTMARLQNRFSRVAHEPFMMSLQRHIQSELARAAMVQ